jgi:hypothetical protein
MIKRVLTAIGSATSVLTVAATCMLLSPSAQADPIPPNSSCSSATSNGQTTSGCGKYLSYSYCRSNGKCYTCNDDIGCVLTGGF